MFAVPSLNLVGEADVEPVFSLTLEKIDKPVWHNHPPDSASEMKSRPFYFGLRTALKVGKTKFRWMESSALAI